MNMEDNSVLSTVTETATETSVTTEQAEPDSVSQGHPLNQSNSDLSTA